MPTILEKIDNYLTEADMFTVKYRAKNKAGKVIDKETKIKATSKEAAMAMAKRKDKNYYEGVSATMNEAIRFETGKFEASHGRKPKGAGNWAFTVNGKEVWVKGMKSYTDAKKQMSKDYKNDKNVFSITVLP
jgi:hypothetical protein